MRREKRSRVQAYLLTCEERDTVLFGDVSQAERMAEDPYYKFQFFEAEFFFKIYFSILEGGGEREREHASGREGQWEREKERES